LKKLLINGALMKQVKGADTFEPDVLGSGSAAFGCWSKRHGEFRQDTPQNRYLIVKKGANADEFAVWGCSWYPMTLKVSPYLFLP
jgi:hypothetical protein